MRRSLAQKSDETAERLIEAIAENGDREAFAALFTSYAPRVKTLLMRSGADADMAEELAQETLLAVWRKADRFQETRGTAAAWIFTIARNLRIDRIRRDRGHRAALVEQADEAGDRDRPDNALISADLADRVRQALGQLSAEQANVLRLSYFHEEPHTAIAAALDIPLGTVKSRLRLATRRLRQLLDDVP